MNFLDETKHITIPEITETNELLILHDLIDKSVDKTIGVIFLLISNKEILIASKEPKHVLWFPVLGSYTKCVQLMFFNVFLRSEKYFELSSKLCLKTFSSPKYSHADVYSSLNSIDSHPLIPALITNFVLLVLFLK